MRIGCLNFRCLPASVTVFRMCVRPRCTFISAQHSRPKTSQHESGSRIDSAGTALYNRTARCAKLELRGLSALTCTVSHADSLRPGGGGDDAVVRGRCRGVGLMAVGLSGLCRFKGRSVMSATKTGHHEATAATPAVSCLLAAPRAEHQTQASSRKLS